jgi:hypothetical protein
MIIELDASIKKSITKMQIDEVIVAIDKLLRFPTT